MYIKIQTINKVFSHCIVSVFIIISFLGISSYAENYYASTDQNGADQNGYKSSQRNTVPTQRNNAMPTPHYVPQNPQPSYTNVSRGNQKKSYRSVPVIQSYSIFWVIPHSNLAVGFIDFNRRILTTMPACIHYLSNRMQNVRYKIDSYIQSLYHPSFNINLLQITYDKAFNINQLGCILTKKVPTVTAHAKKNHSYEALTLSGYGGQPYHSYFIWVQNSRIVKLMGYDSRDICKQQHPSQSQYCFDFAVYGSARTFALIRLALMESLASNLISRATRNH